MATFTSVIGGSWSDVDTWRSVTAWQATHDYSSGDFIKPTVEDGNVYECTTDGGSSGSSEPTWDTTIGNTTADGDLVWTCRAGVPQDGDSVVITAGHSVLMDDDLQGYTGLVTVTIQGHDTTPAMLYWKNGTDGYLKIRTGGSILGTSGTSKGRLLVNSDGVWGNTGALAFANKAVILLEGTSTINARYLDIVFYCYNSISHKYVRTYGTKYDFTAETAVDIVNNTINLGTTPPADGTPVCITTSTGVLPTGFLEDTLYYIRSRSGNTCKLSLMNSNNQIIDITATGSGTCSIVTGHTNTSTSTINVLENVSAETGWIITSGHNRVVLSDTLAPSSYDQQRLTLVAINPGSIQLSANIDSEQYPCGRIYLSSRNVSVRSTVSNYSQAMFDYVMAQTSAGILYCEIVNTYGTGTSTYGVGVYYGTGHEVEIITGCYNGFASCISSSSETSIICNSAFTDSTSCSGTAVSCSTGFRSCISCTGNALGCSNGVTGGFDCTIDTTGCNTGMTSCTSCTGNPKGCYYGFSSCTSCTGNPIGCNYGFGTNCTSCIGNPSYCNNGFSISSGTCTDLTKNTIGIITSVVDLYGATMSNTTDVSTLSGTMLCRSFHHADIANDTRAWSGGGSMTHETSEVPLGKSYSHKFTYTTVTYYNYMQWELSSIMNNTISVPVYAKHDSTGLTSAQRLKWEIITPESDPFTGGVALATWTAADSTDWQSYILSYTRVDNRPLILRVSAKRASGNSYCLAEFTASSGGGIVMF